MNDPRLAKISEQLFTIQHEVEVLLNVAVFEWLRKSEGK